jgi:putative nucleotidyltransferase with HDIG domain
MSGAPSAASEDPTTVLVVDDDEILRDALVRMIEKLQVRVIAAGNGLEARDLLGTQAIDLVISDIRMPGMDGVALTRHIKENHPRVPVILMTGFSEILETQEAFAMGADDFLAKPFDREELFDSIRSCLKSGEARVTPSEIADEDFCRLGIDDFLSGRHIKFNIFVRLSDSKYVKVAHQGEDLSIDRIRAYRSKNVRYLYLRKEDFKSYVGFSVSLVTAASGSDRITREKKLHLLRHTGEVLLEQIRHDGMDQEAFDQSVSFVESTVSVLSENRDIAQLLELLDSHADYLYAHSLGVSLYSTMIARAVGWTLPSNLFKVSVGGLLHDVGEKEIPRDTLMKTRALWTPEEVQLYETHSVRGAEILSQLRYIPADVIQIVQQHHENCQGLGFPSRLKRKSIHPMSKLVSVANEFCERTLKSPCSPGMSPFEAAAQMDVMCSDRLEPEFFGALMRLCRFTPPPKKGGVAFR